MKNQEAIEVIKKNWPSENYTMLREALAVAMQAIEKQIAKETVIGNEVCSPLDEIYGMPSCPMCEEVTYSLDWCPFCGQHLENKEETPC